MYTIIAQIWNNNQQRSQKLQLAVLYLALSSRAVLQAQIDRAKAGDESGRWVVVSFQCV